MPLVADVSAILAQALDDEDASYAEAVIAAIADDEAIVPPLFWFEIRNALLMCERRQRISNLGTESFLADLALLPIQVAEMPTESAVLGLARMHRLTVYDATYLELARRRRLPLATLDEALRSAASREGVALFQP